MTELTVGEGIGTGTGKELGGITGGDGNTGIAGEGRDGGVVGLAPEGSRVTGAVDPTGMVGSSMGARTGADVVAGGTTGAAGAFETITGTSVVMRAVGVFVELGARAKGCSVLLIGVPVLIVLDGALVMDGVCGLLGDEVGVALGDPVAATMSHVNALVLDNGLPDGREDRSSSNLSPSGGSNAIQIRELISS